MRRSTPIAVISLLALLTGVSAASAQEWPKQKPISFVVAFGAGSITDTLARMIGQKLSQLGLDFRRNSLAEFSAFVNEEVPKQAKAVRDSGAKVE